MTEKMRSLVQAGYDKGRYAETLRANPAPTPFELRFLDLLCQQIPTGARILDLGSGTGIPYDRYLAARGYRLTGVDFSHKHIALTRQSVPQATYVRGDVSQVSFAPASFAAIVSFYAIFHLPRQEHAALFGKMHEWLAPGGVILVTLGARDDAYGEEADWAGAPMAWSSYAPDVYRQMLPGIGFTLREEAFEGAPGDEEYHYWLLAQKL